MKITRAAVSMGAAFLLGLASAMAEESEIALKLDKLKEPDAVLGKSDISFARTYTGAEGNVTITAKGVLVPGHQLAFSPDMKEQAITVGGTDFTLAMPAQTFMGKKMKPEKFGFETAKVKLGSGADYYLAFPALLGEGQKRSIAYRSGGAMKGMFGPVGVLFYDDNADGVYGEGDTFGVDGGRLFAPITEKIATGTAVYKIESLADTGASVKVSTVEGATGKVSVKLAGTGLEGNFAFAGDNGVSFISLGDGKAFSVPPGKYKLVYGVLYSKKMKMVAAGVVPGKLEEFEVEDGKTVDLKFGKDFLLTYEVKLDKKKIAISPSFRLFGAGGEEYVGFEVLTQPLPTVMLVEGPKKEYPMGAFSTG